MKLGTKIIWQEICKWLKFRRQRNKSKQAMRIWDAQLKEFKEHEFSHRRTIKTNLSRWRILWLEMPLMCYCRQYRQLLDNEREHTVGHREPGSLNRHNGRQVERSDMTFVQCWITEGRVNHHGGSGRLRKANEREDQAIVRATTFTA